MYNIRRPPVRHVWPRLRTSEARRAQRAQNPNSVPQPPHSPLLIFVYIRCVSENDIVQLAGADRADDYPPWASLFLYMGSRSPLTRLFCVSVPLGVYPQGAQGGRGGPWDLNSWRP